MDQAEPDRTIDLRHEVCPMTFVRTRLALDAMAPGQTLLVFLAGAESQARVPATVRELGHRVVSAELDGGTMRLRVEKRGDLVAPGATG